MSVYVGGTFDLFHAGHVELLRRAAQWGEVWVVLNSDDYVEEFKGKRPIMHFMERAHVLLACEYVEMVIYCDGDERVCLDRVKPDFIVYANDGFYTRESYLERLKVDEDYLRRNGIELVFLDYTEGVSSSDVIERVLQRHCGESCQPLGAQEDAREPDVPDQAPRPGLGACLGGSEPCPCRTEGGLPSRRVPCS